MGDIDEIGANSIAPISSCLISSIEDEGLESIGKGYLVGIWDVSDARVSIVKFSHCLAVCLDDEANESLAH
jgi:hypothetical protein